MRWCGRMGPLLALVAAGYAVGCGPSIRSFTITPRVLCADESAVIDWDASGATELTFAAEPPPASSPTCAIRGRAASAYTLIARRGGKEERRLVEVFELSDQGGEPVAFPTSAIEGQVVVAGGEKDRELWSDRVRVATVAACDGRAIEVRHADRVATIAAGGEPSAAFDGTALEGRWELRSPLSPAEQSHPGSRPKQLAILATFRCQKGTP